MQSDLPQLPFRDFDLEPVVQLALDMQSGFEKRMPCEVCREAQARLLRYALNHALVEKGFEVVRRVSA